MYLILLLDLVKIYHLQESLKTIKVDFQKVFVCFMVLPIERLTTNATL